MVHKVSSVNLKRKISHQDVLSLITRESGMILLQKPSQSSFIKTFLQHSFLFFWIFYLVHQQRDYLIITPQRILLVINNTIVKQYSSTTLHAINFNGSNDSLEFKDQSEHSYISLQSLFLTYTEIHQLKKNLSLYKKERCSI